MLVVLCALFGLAACEETSSANLDKWMQTQKGPGKLKSALRDGDLNAKLRAHAARNLLRMESIGGSPEDAEEVYAVLAGLADDKRQPILADLIERLRQDAYLDKPMAVPSDVQSGAKDALFRLRELADASNRAAIDEHLMAWLADGYYSGRARAGRVQGALIVRAIGPTAAPKLIQRAQALIVAPKAADGSRPQIQDQLLLGLAASADPEAVGLVIDLITDDRGDPRLPQRALDGLFQAFVENNELFPVADGAALVPHLPKLLALAKDDEQPTKVLNDVVRLIGAIGPPACIAPLVELITFPHSAENYMWFAANAALLCGKESAIVAVADALPRTGQFKRESLAGALWEPMAALPDKALVHAQALALLGSESWVSRLIGVELLGQLALPANAVADAARIRLLAGDKAPLQGWWGDQSEVPKRERKPLPRLGERAEEVAKQLDLVIKGTQK